MWIVYIQYKEGSKFEFLFYWFCNIYWYCLSKSKSFILIFLWCKTLGATTCFYNFVIPKSILVSRWFWSYQYVWKVHKRPSDDSTYCKRIVLAHVILLNSYKSWNVDADRIKAYIYSSLPYRTNIIITLWKLLRNHHYVLRIKT